MLQSVRVQSSSSTAPPVDDTLSWQQFSGMFDGAAEDAIGRALRQLDIPVLEQARPQAKVPRELLLASWRKVMEAKHAEERLGLKKNSLPFLSELFGRLAVTTGLHARAQGETIILHDCILFSGGSPRCNLGDQMLHEQSSRPRCALHRTLFTPKYKQLLTCKHLHHIPKFACPHTSSC